MAAGIKKPDHRTPVPRLWGRNSLGVSVRVEVLLDKYRSAQATHRLLSYFAPLSLGTVTGGLQRLASLVCTVRRGPARQTVV